MGRVVHFEIDAVEPERAIKFYEGVFGWEIRRWKGPYDYWLIMTGDPEEGGIDGGLQTRDGDQPSTVMTIDVNSAEEAVAKVMAAGGRLVRDIQTIPGVGHFAYCEDTEGNVFGVMHSDETAH
jgi:predicted enzyme related to lactoylglutathione lyase